MKLVFFFIRLYFRILSFLFPKLAGKSSFELFQKPHNKKIRSRELQLFEDFEEVRIKAPEEDLYCYEKGESGYPLLLVHGWDSNPGSMYAIAKRLAEDGARVIVMGLPAHCKSKLPKTNMIHASEMIQKVMEHYGFREHFSMITHSFGSGASTVALMGQDIRPDKLIFLTTPDRMWDIFDNYVKMIHLGKKAYSYLIKKVEMLTPIKMDDFNISDLIGRVKYDQLILIQDQEDSILPWENANKMKEKNPGIELITTHGKGHYRLLWDEEVIQMVSKRIAPLL